MEKIVIIGSSGAGKTTLAKKLGPMLGMKVFYMDRFFWTRDWKKKDNDTRIDILQKIVMDKRWIIEGSYFGTSEPRLDEADTIIFLDIYPFLCLLRIIKRHYKCHGLFRRDIPEGCTDRLTLLGMLEVLIFPWLKRKKLMQYLSNCKTKKIYRLKSAKAIDKFLVEIRKDIDKQSKLSNGAVADTEEKSLASIGR